MVPSKMVYDTLADVLQGIQIMNRGFNSQTGLFIGLCMYKFLHVTRYTNPSFAGL